MATSGSPKVERKLPRSWGPVSAQDGEKEQERAMEEEEGENTEAPARVGQRLFLEKP